MGAAKQTQARLIDQRARRRAASDLQALYPDEWQAFYETRYIEAADEVAELEEARAASSDAHVTDEPVRLMPGRRRAEQAPADRIDVARCPHCVKSHDRNHVCPKCGSVPKLTFNEQVTAVREMYDRGADPKVIATTMRLPHDHVLRLLDGDVG